MGLFARMPPAALFNTAGETPRAPREPDALVLAILCDPKSLEPNALVAHIIKELRRLHGDKLDNLRDSLKMLDVLSGNRGLQEQNTLFLYTPSSYAKLSPSETILVGFMFHRGACY